MYEKGLLAVSECGMDCRTEGGYDWDKTHVYAWLPHSCDHWIVGGKQEIQWLIDDLKEALSKVEGGVE